MVRELTDEIECPECRDTISVDDAHHVPFIDKLVNGLNGECCRKADIGLLIHTYKGVYADNAQGDMSDVPPVSSSTSPSPDFADIISEAISPDNSDDPDYDPAVDGGISMSGLQDDEQKASEEIDAEQEGQDTEEKGTEEEEGPTEDEDEEGREEEKIAEEEIIRAVSRKRARRDSFDESPTEPPRKRRRRALKFDSISSSTSPVFNKNTNTNTNTNNRKEAAEFEMIHGDADGNVKLMLQINVGEGNYRLKDGIVQCKWKGKRGDISRHDNECPFQVVECPYDSRHKYYRFAESDHLSKCPMKPLQCPYCHGNVDKSLFAVHKRYCHDAPVVCKYKPYGCKMADGHTRRTIKLHYERAAQYHLDKCLEFIGRAVDGDLTEIINMAKKRDSCSKAEDDEW